MRLQNYAIPHYKTDLLKQKEISAILKNNALLVLGALACMIMAIYNGYPLVYSDTSTYLSSGFELETPLDRPITYGLFIRLTSFNGFSLWLTVFFQSLLLVYLVKCLLAVLKIKRPALAALLVMGFCAFITGLSWSASQLIADIFTPMLIITWALISLDKQSGIKTQLFYGALLFFISSMHMSHFVMSAIFSVFLLLLRINKTLRDFIPARKIILILIASGLSFIVFASSYSKFKHVFFVAKMNESGLLKTILEEECPAHNFKMCLYKDSLPATSTEFMWEKTSPLYKLGGYKEVKPEFKEIISTALSNKKYVTKIISSSAAEVARQLYYYGIGDGNGVFMEGTTLHERIKKYVPSETGSYESSRQQKNKLFNMDKVNFFLSAVFLTSLTVFFVILIFMKSDFAIKFFGVVLLCGLLINAAVCGTLAPVSDRFGCRVVWFIPFYALLMLLKKIPAFKV